MNTPENKSFKTYLPIAVLILIYLVTRLYGLTASPMNSLEATWIHWAQIVLQYPSEILIAGNSGEQPLFTWVTALTLNIFPDPLFAGRFVSVLAGLASMTGLYCIGGRTYNRTIGLLAAFIYIVFPYAYFFDRLALPAGLFTAWIIWILRWSLHIGQETRPQEKAFRILGILTGTALLTHWIAGLAFVVLFFMFYIWRVHQRPGFWNRLAVCFGIALIMNVPVLLNASYEESVHLRYDKKMSSGVGVREAAQFLAKEAEAYRRKTGVPLPVMLPISPGHPSEGIAVYLWNHPDVRLVPAFWWPESHKLIPSGLRFSHRPSIYQTHPVKRRETTLLRHAHIIFPAMDYSREKFLQENPRFRKIWSLSGSGGDDAVTIYQNQPPK